MINDSFILAGLAACFLVLSVVCGIICLVGTIWRLYDYRKELRAQEHFTNSNPIRDLLMRDTRGNILVWAIWTTIYWIIAICMDIYIM